jgi:hypothetical protein
MPHSEVVFYFKGSSDFFTKEKVIVDNDGHFSITIPKNLEQGPNLARISHRDSQGVLLKDLTIDFVIKEDLKASADEKVTTAEVENKFDVENKNITKDTKLVQEKSILEKVINFFILILKAIGSFFILIFDFCLACDYLYFFGNS